ncbi:unnamed protein product [Blumeria hordei]|uniref:EKC/KEOPS complex subunit BUD32 n=1 Tax=Blumeria hordei TaxID=2867405 RepID=A0A383UR70_BLUHO|nr:unnamed protein product [Blumeria hordei]
MSSTTPLCANLPKSFSDSCPTLISQGAEAFLFKTTFLIPNIPAALKFRPSKVYRHPTLDARLKKHRILSEARILTKCRTLGVPVPTVYALDEKDGWLMMEWVEGKIVRTCINECLLEHMEADLTELKGCGDGLQKFLCKIGNIIGKMHSIGVVHGDLTTSNIMLNPKSNEDNDSRGDERLEGSIMLIDFGLASQSLQDEDRAVDLYVLERAFGSTHPRIQHLFAEVIKSYGTSYKGAGIVLKKLEDVRMRGRKKSMIG